MPVELLYALPLGLTLSFSAGPVFFVVIQTSIKYGKVRAAMFDLGVIVADLVHISIAFYGSQQFIHTVKNNLWVAIISGLAIMIFGFYYINKSKIAGQFQSEYTTSRKRIFFVKGLLMNLLNIGVLFYWITTTVAVGSLLDHNPEHMKIFYTGVLLTYLCLDALKIYFAHRFKERLSGRTIQIIEKILGFILIIFGLVIIARNLFF